MGRTIKQRAAMIIYHGSTDTIKLPLAKVGRPDLDFGQGFYTTDILDQAKLWADRMHQPDLYNKPASHR